MDKWKNAAPQYELEKIQINKNWDPIFTSHADKVILKG